MLKILQIASGNSTSTRYFTTHSLRATCAARLYHAGMDKQLITEITGHKSNAVRLYKRTNDDLKQKASNILDNSNPADYKKQIETSNYGTNNNSNSIVISGKHECVSSKCTSHLDKKMKVEINGKDQTIMVVFE